MSDTVEIKVPDIGDFEGVEIIEVLVKAGDTVEAEDPLITLESDKATMEVPAPEGGTVREMKVKEGDKVSEGDPILLLEPAGRTAEPAAADKPAATRAQDDTARQPAPAQSQPGGSADYDCDVIVLGSGPGGYSAAFRAADLGQKVVLVERYESLGGVCLNVGCIPSKALLHAAKVIDDAAFMADHGVEFGAPKVSVGPLREWKQSVVKKLTGGIAGLAKRRKVRVVQGTGAFTGAHQMQITGPDGQAQTITFANAIIAAGSQAMKLPMMPADDERVMDSTSALELAEIPKRLLVVGGGIIGLEMANVYASLGAKTDVVEMLPSLLNGVDSDIVKPLQKRMQQRLDNIYLKTKVTDVKAAKKGLTVSFDGEKAPKTATYDRILVAVGRKPNGNNIGAEQAGVTVEQSGFIATDKQMRTNVAHIFAIGDIARQPLLAHKAVHEGKVAAEVAAGEKSAFDARCIPSVVYTDPEVAWTGVTENDAKEQGIDYDKGSFPWAANGRSLGMGYDQGLTKLLFDKQSGRVIGGAAVGPNAGDLIAEVSLAIEMGCDAHDIGLTIHPHPTLSETIGMSAEAVAGTLTDLYVPKK